MTTANPTDVQIRRRRALLDELRRSARTMLEELAQVVGVARHERLYEEPSGTLPDVAEFCRRTDFTIATEDGRIWLRNRIGLFITRYFVVRYGGQLELQEDAGRAFYLHYVVAGMDPPIAPGARVDPFALAHDVINAHPKPELVDLIHDAERALLGLAPNAVAGHG